MIQLGTACYLVRNAEFAWLNGRVAEVVDYYDVDQDGAVWHVLAAPWIREVFGDRLVLAREGNLRPICPPALQPAQRDAALMERAR